MEGLVLFIVPNTNPIRSISKPQHHFAQGHVIQIKDIMKIYYYVCEKYV